MRKYRAKKFIFAVESGGDGRKVLQIIFGADGSLYVNFPYFKHTNGLVSLATFPANTSGPTELKLEPGGKATSHLVKYAHHPDGRAHFSQDGRVMSTVRKQSVPLSKMEGHIFTVQLQGLIGFEATDFQKDSGALQSSKRLLNFNFQDQKPEAIKIVGRWYSDAELSQRAIGNVEGPVVRGQTPEGKIVHGFLISAPKNTSASSYTLMVSCEAIPFLSMEEEKTLTFIGGFDPSSIVNDLSKETKLLAFSYPASDYEELRSRVGTIDFIRQVKV